MNERILPPEYFLPPELREAHCDALIIYSEDSPDDQQKALELMDTINSFRFDGENEGKAVIFDEAVSYANSLVDRLDEALKFCTLKFVIYSSDLANDYAASRSSNAVLWQTIEEHAERNTFIPVIWKQKDSRPAYVKEIQALDMGKGNWKDKLKKLINMNLSKKLERSRDQEQRQKQYLETNLNNRTGSDAASRHVLEPSATRSLHQLHSLDNLDVHSDLDKTAAENEKNNRRKSLWRWLRDACGGRKISLGRFCALCVLSLSLLIFTAQRTRTR